MSLTIKYSSKPILEPQPGCDWADKMVLNPAIIADPDNPDTIHMLFRATGPWSSKQQPGQPLPYPIFLGYAVSNDRGQSWEPDFSRPALAPSLETEPDKITITNYKGETVLDHSNGCIEDPRLFYFENELYLSAACRLFAPGPYWDNDEPMQCAPAWATENEHKLGLTASENITVTVMFKVDLEALKRKDYDNAFTYVCPLHNPRRGDNRDVFLFPRKLKINGKEQIVCLHRPKAPERYEEGKGLPIPSIFLAAGDSFEQLTTDEAEQHVLATKQLDWEANRIGASWAPIELDNGQWLLPYHGKKDDQTGYTQSFMILEEQAEGFPKIIHRCSERLIYARQDWELEGEFTIPCIFTCGGIILSDNTLLMSYGAADKRAGVAEVDFSELVNYIRTFDAEGNKIT